MVFLYLFAELYAGYLGEQPIADVAIVFSLRVFALGQHAELHELGIAYVVEREEVGPGLL